MAYGDLKVRNLIWNTGSGDNTVVLSTLLTGSSPNWTGTATGVNLTLSGDLQVNGTTTTINTTTLQVEDKNIEIGKVSSPSDTTADGGGWSLLGATTKTFNWVNATDAWTSSEHIHLGDNKKLIVGTGQDLQIYHDGSNSYVNNTGTGYLILQGNGSSDVSIRAVNGESGVVVKPNGGASKVELYYDNGKKAETSADGLNITGMLSSTGNIQIPNDTSKLRLGASQDLEIYHNGTDSYINHTPTSGKLQIRTDEIRISSYAGDEAMIKSFKDAATYLYYDGSNKLATTSSGVTVNGKVGIGFTSFNDAAEYLLVGSTTTAANISIVANNTNHSSLNLGDEDDFNIQKIKSDHTDNSLQFFTNDGERFRFGSSGQLGISGANYGTSGQVLTSGGPSAAPSWAAPASGGGGLSEIDAWCLSGSWPTGTWSNNRLGNASNDTGTGTFTRNSEHNMPIGTGVTNTNGLFTFPSTGTWEVTFQCYLQKIGTNYPDVKLTMCNTNATGGGETLAETSTTLTANDHYHAAMSMSAMFKVTNTTNNNVWVRLNSDTTLYMLAGSKQNMLFKKLT